MLNKTWLIARKAAASVGGVGCLVIGFCLVAQIFCRTFLGIALSWSEEIAQCGMIFMVFLALAEVEAGNEHLQVEILFTALPKLAFPMTIIGKLNAFDASVTDETALSECFKRVFAVWYWREGGRA